jgi:hypothetical protein
MENQEHYLVAHGAGMRIGVHWNDGVRLWQLHPDVCQQDLRPLLQAMRDELAAWLTVQPTDAHDKTVLAWLAQHGLHPEGKPEQAG